MTKAEVKALFYITPIENLPSIIKIGLVCYTKSLKLRAKSIADSQVQERREKIIPGTKLKVHSFVNLYFNPRNPMMFKRRSMHEELCVLAIHKSILDEDGVILADGNASSDYTRFYPSPDGLKELNSDYIFAEYWTHEDYFEGLRRKRQICAETLVPKNLEVGFISGIYVSCKGTLDRVVELLGDHSLQKKVTINTNLFFL